MLRITTEANPAHVTLRLEGKLAGPWVGELEHCWQSAAGGSATPVILDMAQVDYIDSGGKQLLARMHAAGVRLLASTPWNRAVIDEIRLGKAAALGILCMVLLAGAVRAQQPAPLVLTLRDAVRTALKQNPQVQIANLNLAQSQEENIIARSALLPQAALQGSEAAQRLNIYALLGRPFPGVPQHAGPFWTFQSAGAGSVPVFDLTLWRRWRASRETSRAVAADQQTTREQVTLLVVSQYLGALRAAADVTAARSRVDLAQALYNQAEDLLKAGVGTRIDVLRASVELQNERQRLIAAETQSRTTLFGLVRLLTLDPRQAVTLGDQMSFYETPPVSLDQSLEAAFANRPELKALRFRQQALQSQVEAARASRLPSLHAQGNWGYTGLTTPAAAIPAYTFAVGVNMPLFTGGRIGAETARADLEVRKTRQLEQQTRDTVAFEVKTAAAQLESARNEVSVANLGVTLAREELDQARDRFQAGVANNLEVVSAQDALARANDNQIVALYRYSQARADLARAAGQTEALYAK